LQGWRAFTPFGSLRIPAQKRADSLTFSFLSSTASTSAQISLGAASVMTITERIGDRHPGVDFDDDASARDPYIRWENCRAWQRTE
jgi:hypothetical protein